MFCNFYLFILQKKVSLIHTGVKTGLFPRERMDSVLRASRWFPESTAAQYEKKQTGGKKEMDSG